MPFTSSKFYVVQKDKSGWLCWEGVAALFASGGRALVWEMLPNNAVLRSGKKRIPMKEYKRDDKWIFGREAV